MHYTVRKDVPLPWLCWLFYKFSPWMSVWDGGHIENYFAANDNFAGYQSFLRYERKCNRCGLTERTTRYMDTKGWGM